MAGASNTRVDFVPIPRGYGARLSQLDPGDWWKDTAQFLSAVKRERALLRPRTWILAPDPLWVASAAGCDVRRDGVDGRVVGRGAFRGETPADLAVPELIASGAPRVYAEALRALAREGNAATGCIPGPWTLAEQLWPVAPPPGDDDRDRREDLLDDAVVACTALVRALLENGSRDVALWETLSRCDASLIPRVYRPLFRVLDHFGAKARVLVTGAGVGSAALYDVPQVAAVLFPRLDALQVREVPTLAYARVGVGLDPAVLGTRELDADAVAGALRRAGAAILSPEVPAGAVPEKVRALVDRFAPPQEGARR